jgi:hypothetical protein
MRDKFKREWADKGDDVVVVPQTGNTETEEERTKEEMDSELEAMDDDLDDEEADDGDGVDADTQKLQEQLNA